MKTADLLQRLRPALTSALIICTYGCEPSADGPSTGTGGPAVGPGVVQGPPATVNPGPSFGAPITPPATGTNLGGPTAPIAPVTPPMWPDAGANPDTPPPAATSNLWCNARAVLQTRCQTCHGTEPAGAPMSLVTYADTQKPSTIDATKTVVQLIKSRAHDAARPMPPIAQGPLTAPELGALDAWLNAGAPAGTCTTPDEQAPAPSQEFKWPEECTPDRIYKVQAHQNGQPYPVPGNWESNVSISIPVPWAGKVSGDVQAIAIRPLTNNKRVVHHWILFAGTLEFITSWSPGKPAEAFPADVGVYMPASGTFSLNMHYYNKGNSSAEKDSSGAEICLGTKPRPKMATTNMFGPFLFTVAAGKSEVSETCTQLGVEPVTLITSSPHMHKTGVGGKFEIIRASGQVEVLEDTPFDQEDQHVTTINAVLNSGDQVRTTCRFNNTSGVPKTFGQSTEDEMCFNFSRYYPMGALSCLPSLF
jgi:Copper type II ascorbate-dependent monooxygenase, C-terminal domain